MTMTREVQVLQEGWRFCRGASPGAAELAFDDAAWAAVRVPHDWAITGPFHREHDIQQTRIVADGEEKVSEHTGRTGGLPHVGEAWYRRHLELPLEREGQRVFLEFDGIMSHSTIWVNGSSLGGWPYGYSSFSVEITEAIRWGGENLLAVHVDNPPLASRWYPGAGMYRNVRLILVHPVHIPQWGTYVQTEALTDDQARLSVATEIVNQTGQQQVGELISRVYDPNGALQAEHTVEFTVDSTARVGDSGMNKRFRITQSMVIPHPQRWDIRNPRLYQLVSQVRLGKETVDEYQTGFGLREVSFDSEQGFRLNGRSLKLQGVCLHHDLGALGTAVSYRAIERQLELLKDMGANAIRTSHNPPAPELLDLCDRMGFLVIDEAFDEWAIKKCENGYHKLFPEWSERDLRAMLRRDRNHPAIIMWSIGNEIPEQRDPNGARTARRLTAICHEEDGRPVTAGFNHPEDAIANGLAAAVDIPGWNYKPHLYSRYRSEYPDWIMYGSETASCVSSRGEYYLPAKEQKDPYHHSFHLSAYDMASPGWGYAPDYEFAAQDDIPEILGEFVWTGFDYLGEPTPYKQAWPSRSSYFGIVDLAGFPKDRYYLYRSQWSDQPTLHLLPHWNWEGLEGQPIPVFCYTSYPAVELFLNGRSLGVKNKPQEGHGAVYDRYRLVWPVPYEPGELRAAAYNRSGTVMLERCILTAGRPAGLEMVCDRTKLTADGNDLCFVTVRVVDKAGVLCPFANDRIRFQVQGPAAIAAVDNGDQTSLDPFQTDTCRTFHGQCLLVLRTIAQQAGTVRIHAGAQGLASQAVALETRC